MDAPGESYLYHMYKPSQNGGQMASTDTPSVIRTHNLGKTYGDVIALQDVNLRVPSNSIFGFLGPNGAGKTTLMKILLGLARPTSGGGEIFDLDILKENIAIKERIGYLPQHPRFIENMTAFENLEFTARFFFSGPKKLVRERCREMLELVGLADKANRAIKNFSGGEKQRLGIALAQVNYPDLLILDEPASALDPLGRQSVLEIMERLQKHTTVFYSTHILDDVQQVSDYVAILNQGKLVASGPIEQLLRGQETAIYTVGIKGANPNLDQRLSAFPWVQAAKCQHQNGVSYWQVEVSDEDQADRYLLRSVLEDPDLQVVEYQRKKYELEEVFLDIIKGDNHVS
jgi:ABC-2 type transport system ATP-binding protein